MSQATNSLGWVVQQYVRETGWAAVTMPFPTKEEANEQLGLHCGSADQPFRVYESLDHPNQRTQ